MMAEDEEAMEIDEKPRPARSFSHFLLSRTRILRFSSSRSSLASRTSSSSSTNTKPVPAKSKSSSSSSTANAKPQASLNSFFKRWFSQWCRIDSLIRSSACRRRAAQRVVTKEAVVLSRRSILANSLLRTRDLTLPAPFTWYDSELCYSSMSLSSNHSILDDPLDRFRASVLMRDSCEKRNLAKAPSPRPRKHLRITTCFIKSRVRCAYRYRDEPPRLTKVTIAKKSRIIERSSVFQPWSLRSTCCKLRIHPDREWRQRQRNRLVER